MKLKPIQMFADTHFVHLTLTNLQTFGFQFHLRSFALYPHRADDSQSGIQFGLYHAVSRVKFSALGISHALLPSISFLS